MADQPGEGTVATTDDQSTDNGTVQQNNGEQNGEVAVAAPPQPAPAPGGWSMIKTLVIRMVVIYFISSWLRRPAAPKTGQVDGTGRPLMSIVPSTNLFMRETEMDMYVYVSEAKTFRDFRNQEALFWKQEDLVYGDWTAGLNKDGNFEKKGEIKISENMMNNKSSLYLHVFIVRTGMSPDPKEENYGGMDVIKKTKQLNKFKKRKFHKTVNLLTGTTDAHPDLVRAPDDNTTLEILSHWHPNLTINLIDDHTPWVNGSVPAPLDDFIEYVPGMQAYYPIVFFNEYWNLNSEYMPINQTTPKLNLTLTYQPISLFRWQMYAAQGMRQRWYSFLGDDFMEESDEDQDSLKQTFLETNPYLLGLTIVVSIVHSVFEFLAFKNDIQFWRNRKSMEGLSVRSVFFNVFQSLVVLLYVLDHETNFVIRVSVFAGLAIEIWKIFKVIDVTVDRENKWFGLIPRVTLAEKATYTKSATKKYDMLAFKYLSWALFPLLGCYAVYSLFYVEHKGWYSWVLSMMYGFLLTFGFIMMTPQLFINYKLKSVAHLPWRMLTYKALNTFIDDLFAFVIKMPTLYRLGCFRDDVVFLVYVYQRYKYRVDPKRVNEFGTSADMFDENGVALPPPEAGDSQAAIEESAGPQEAIQASGDAPKADTGTSPKNKKNKSKGKDKSKDKPKDKAAKKKD